MKKKLSLHEFTDQIDGFYDLGIKNQVDYLVFYLTNHAGYNSVTAKTVNEQLAEHDLHKYKRLPQYLSDASRTRDGKYVKLEVGGYKLNGKLASELSATLTGSPVKNSLDKKLVQIVKAVGEDDERAFLEEALKCYQVAAYRAAIVMIWIVTVDHMQNYILANKLNEFNAELKKNPDRKVKLIVIKDDFSDLPENKFIELCRAGNIISNDVRKILDAKLGIRNSAAHPSGITVGEHKAVEFGIDLINNVIIKYTDVRSTSAFPPERSLDASTAWTARKPNPLS